MDMVNGWIYFFFATNIFQQKQSTLIFIIKTETGKNLFRLFSPTQMVEHT